MTTSTGEMGINTKNALHFYQTTKTILCKSILKSTYLWWHELHVFAISLHNKMGNSVP